MVLDRMATDVEPFGDDLVSVAQHHRFDNIPFPRGESKVLSIFWQFRRAREFPQRLGTIANAALIDPVMAGRYRTNALEEKIRGCFLRKYGACSEPYAFHDLGSLDASL